MALAFVDPDARTDGDPRAVDPGARTDAGVALAGQLVYLVLGYSTILLVARTAGPRALGIYSIAVLAITGARLVCMGGMPQACLRYIPLYLAASQPEYVRGLLRFSSRLAFLAGAVIAGLLIAAIVAGGRVLFSDRVLTGALVFTLTALPVYALQGTWSYALQGFRKIRQKVIVENVVEPAFRVAGVAVSVAAGATLLAGVFGLLSGVLFSAVAAYAFLRRQAVSCAADAPPRFARRSWLAYSLPLSLNSLIVLLQPGIPLLLIEYLHGSFHVGVFNAAWKMAALISLPVIALNTVFAPRIPEAAGNTEPRTTLESQFKTMTAWTIVLSLPLAIVVLSFAGPIMRLFGPEFAPGVRALTVLAAANLVVAVCGSAGCILVMTGHSRLSLANALLATGLSILLYVRLIPTHGTTGAAVASACGMAAAGVLSLLEVFYILRISPYSRKALTPVISGGLAAVLLAAVPDGGPMAVRLLLFSPAYLGFLWLFGARDKRGVAAPR